MLPARTALRSDDADSAGTKPVDGTEFDFREARSIGATKLDTCFTDLEREATTVARASTLTSPDGARASSLWTDESYPYLMLFTGDTGPTSDGGASRSSP